MLTWIFFLGLSKPAVCEGARAGVGMQQKWPPCQSNSSHPSPLPHLKCISNASQIHLKYIHTSNTEIFLIRILIFFLTLCTIRSVDKFGIVEKQLTRTLSAVTWLRHKMSDKLWENSTQEYFQDFKKVNAESSIKAHSPGSRLQPLGKGSWHDF